MKKEALNHTKMKQLGRRLGSIILARGIMESLWHLAKVETPRGDIGRLSDEEIAIGIDYDGDITQLIGWLVEFGWLDRDDEHRLLVHDWFDHAEDSVHLALARRGIRFCCGRVPNMGRMNKNDREKSAKLFEDSEVVRVPHARDTHATRTEHARDTHGAGTPNPTSPHLTSPHLTNSSPPAREAVSTDSPDETTLHVELSISSAMKLKPSAAEPTGLRAGRRERQIVWEHVAGWRRDGPVRIRGEPVPVDAVMRAAADVLRARESGGTAKTCCKFIGEVIDRCRREGVWPNEYLAPKQAETKRVAQESGTNWDEYFAAGNGGSADGGGVPP